MLDIYELYYIAIFAVVVGIFFVGFVIFVGYQAYMNSRLLRNRQAYIDSRSKKPVQEGKDKPQSDAPLDE